jgi:hypothetical protein
MLEGFFFLFFFSLYLLTYPLRLLNKHKHKHKPKSEHKPKVFYPLVEETFRTLEYDYGEESTAEIDLQDGEEA